MIIAIIYTVIGLVVGAVGCWCSMQVVKDYSSGFHSRVLHFIVLLCTYLMNAICWPLAVCNGIVGCVDAYLEKKES